MSGEPTELVSSRLDQRFADMLFIADRRGERRKVLFHLEFQATVDPDMAPRIMAYAGLALLRLRSQSPELRRDGALVAVTMVLYHGKGRWTAPVPAELSPGLVECVLIEPAAVGLAEVRAEHIPEMVLGLLVPGQKNPILRQRLDTIAPALTRGVRQQLREHILQHLALALHPFATTPCSRRYARWPPWSKYSRKPAEWNGPRPVRKDGRKDGRKPTSS